MVRDTRFPGQGRTTRGGPRSAGHTAPLPPPRSRLDRGVVDWITVVAVAWVVVGGITAVAMVRRGHDAATWAGIGFLFGPLAVAAAVAASRASTAGGDVRVLATGRPGPGGVDVLVGLDGSPEAGAALAAAVDLHGDRIGRLTLAAVVPHDAEPGPEVALTLDDAARTVAGLEPGRVILRGEPAAALARHAAEEGYALVVVGARGRGRSSSPLGSVAARLAGGAAVPVLVGARRS